MKRIEPWEYSGDVNLEYGGTFIKYDPQEWNWGYLDAVQVSDLDSGCGFRGAVMIEERTIIVRKGKEAKRALESCGPGLHFARNLPAEFRTKRQLRLILAEALLSYGHCDPGDRETEILQLESGEALDFDRWHARRYRGDLRRYVEKQWLR